MSAEPWTKAESQLLIAKVLEHGMARNNINWASVLASFPGRNVAQCSSRLRRMKQDEAQWGIRGKLHRARQLQAYCEELKISEQDVIAQVINILRN